MTDSGNIGAVCPACSMDRGAVLKVVRAPSTTIRQRKCRLCNVQFCTEEVTILEQDIGAHDVKPHVDTCAPGAESTLYSEENAQ